MYISKEIDICAQYIYIYVHSLKMVKLRFILAVLSVIISVLRNTLKPSVEHSNIEQKY